MIAWFSTCGLASSADNLSSSIRRFEALAGKESRAARVDSLLRAAQILSHSAPTESARFKRAALRELANVEITGSMVVRLLSVDPNGGEALLLSMSPNTAVLDRLVDYWMSRADASEVLALLREAEQRWQIRPTMTGALARAIAEADPAMGVNVLRELVHDADKGPTSAGLIADVAVGTARGLATAAAGQQNATVSALRRLVAIVRSEQFRSLRPRRDGSRNLFVGSTAVPVRSSQDVLLVRMAALMKVLDPDLLRENRDLFASIEPAAATVSNLKGVQDISESLPWKPVGSRSIT